MSRFLKTAVAFAVAGAAVLFAGTAAAQPGGAPVAGDDRATAYSGNAVGKDCAKLFPGSQVLGSGDLTTSVDGTNTYLDVNGFAEGIVVLGVVVKGGPAYNVYKTGDLGGPPPWLDLHSPHVSSGKPAQISHWFACGVGVAISTTPSEPTDPSSEPTETSTDPSETDPTETTEPSTPGESSSAETTPSAPDSSVAGTDTTTSADVAPVAEDEDLASTGFNGGWLVALGAALLLGGGALLLIMRTRAARD